jgi:chemotaxis methyl-accepting protein methylase
MYKTGIYNIGQLSSSLPEKSFLTSQPIALDLYMQTDKLDQTKRDLIEEKILNFSFSDGSYKKTHSHRFTAFDEKIVAYLEKNLAKDKKCRIHDLGVSDGRTSLELFLLLEKIFPEFDFYASDKNMFVQVFFDKKNKGRRIIKDEDGKILQIIIPPFVLDVYSQKRSLSFSLKKTLLYPVNIILTKLLLIPLFRNLFFKINETEKQKIPLLQNKVLELVKVKNNFHLLSYNLFQKMTDEFDIIRAMNVINLSCFNEAEAGKITANILFALREGGIFIVGSNKAAGSEVNGDLMIKKNGRFESLLKFGNGAQFREIILAANTPLNA